jgi:sugar phosphate isomerase/epimerase
VFRLGYNTNGLAHHRPVEAVRLLAELGYEGVALTPDVGGLDPLDPDPAAVAGVRAAAQDAGLALVVETGARFVLDPRRKHFPTLLEEAAPDRRRRLDFLRRMVDLALELGADTLSFWAGRAPGGETGDAHGAAAHPALWERLAAGVAAVLEHARGSGVALAFEPEPGMFVERPAGFHALRERLGAQGEELGLCLDVGHLLCTGDLPVGAAIRREAAALRLVHLDDIRGGVHEHRMFGEGDLDLSEVLGALLEVSFTGLAAVELSRDSHRGPAAAREALEHLRAALRARNAG